MNNEQVVCSDCLEYMRTMPENSVDSIVTDPPYGLSFMNKEWDSFGTDTRQPGDEHYWVPDNPYGRANVRYGWNQDKSKLAMSNRAFQEGMTPIFKEALRVAKPGAHLLCFGGTRTFHRMACAIEDAGWEIRDCIMWVYGSGFPKSMDVSKAIDRKYGADAAAQWDGWGTCLKPAWEPIIVARKPLDGTVAHNVLTWGVGALNIDACRVDTGEQPKPCVGNGYRAINDKNAEQGYRPNSYSAEKASYNPNTKGRFPANLVHDGSQMVLDLFPESKGQQGNVAGSEPSRPTDGVCYGEYSERQAFAKRGDIGSAARFFNTLRDGEESADRTYTDRGGTNFAAKPGKRREPTSADRFFYCAKASKKERGEGNNHPTVKPIALMKWLVTLVTPEGG